MPRRHRTTASKANESAWKDYAEFLEGQTEATEARLRAIANPGLAALRQSPVSIDLRHKLAEAFPEKAHNLPPLQEIFHDFFQFAGRHGAEYPHVAEALALRKEAMTNYRFTKKDLAATQCGEDGADGKGDKGGKVDKDGVAKVDKDGVAKVDKDGVAKVDKDGVAKVDKDGVAKVDKDGVAKVDKDGVAKVDKDGVAKVDKDGVAKGGEDEVAKGGEGARGSVQGRQGDKGGEGKEHTDATKITKVAKASKKQKTKSK
ncbi:hypothetical protein GGU11DRAFT_751052 [Lentinula aff. detonsa]|nr:hypothetical protein GGU11DRAFT_751052 [Lentinula aff. detonsa]